MNDPSSTIAAQLKTLRNTRGLTLDQLSGLAGVSKAMLSQIEQNKVNPTIATMIKIADALQVNLTDLINTRKRASILRIIPADDEHYTFRKDKNCVIRTLSPLNLEKNIELYQITLEAGGILDSEPHAPGTQEFLFLAKGKLDVTSGTETARISKGDSIHYRADVPHTIKNITSSQALAYLTVQYK